MDHSEFLQHSDAFPNVYRTSLYDARTTALLPALVVGTSNPELMARIEAALKSGECETYAVQDDETDPEEEASALRRQVETVNSNLAIIARRGFLYTPAMLGGKYVFLRPGHAPSSGLMSEADIASVAAFLRWSGSCIPKEAPVAPSDADLPEDFGSMATQEDLVAKALETLVDSGRFFVINTANCGPKKWMENPYIDQNITMLSTEFVEESIARAFAFLEQYSDPLTNPRAEMMRIVAGQLDTATKALHAGGKPRSADMAQNMARSMREFAHLLETEPAGRPVSGPRLTDGDLQGAQDGVCGLTHGDDVAQFTELVDIPQAGTASINVRNLMRGKNPDMPPAPDPTVWDRYRERLSNIGKGLRGTDKLPRRVVSGLYELIEAIPMGDLKNLDPLLTFLEAIAEDFRKRTEGKEGAPTVDLDAVAVSTSRFSDAELFRKLPDERDMAMPVPTATELQAAYDAVASVFAETGAIINRSARLISWIVSEPAPGRELVVAHAAELLPLFRTEASKMEHYGTVVIAKDHEAFERALQQAHLVASGEAKLVPVEEDAPPTHRAMQSGMRYDAITSQSVMAAKKDARAAAARIDDTREPAEPAYGWCLRHNCGIVPGEALDALGEGDALNDPEMPEGSWYVRSYTGKRAYLDSNTA